MWSWKRWMKTKRQPESSRKTQVLNVKDLIKGKWLIVSSKLEFLSSSAPLWHVSLRDYLLWQQQTALQMGLKSTRATGVKHSQTLSHNAAIRPISPLHGCWRPRCLLGCSSFRVRVLGGFSGRYTAQQAAQEGSRGAGGPGCSCTATLFRLNVFISLFCLENNQING